MGWTVKNVKKCLGFWGKNRDCVHLWVKFCIQNIVLGVSRRKNSKTFVLLTKCLSNCPNSTKPPLPLLHTWRKYFDSLTVRNLLGLSFCYRISTNPLGKIRPEDVPRRHPDVLRTSLLGPICNAKGIIRSGLPLGRTQDVISTIIHKMGF